jgi:hypothetical protein
MMEATGKVNNCIPGAIQYLDSIHPQCSIRKLSSPSYYSHETLS